MKRRSTPVYRIAPAEPGHLPRLAAIERAAAECFPPDLMPLTERRAVLPGGILGPAMTEGRLWVALDGRERPVGFALAADCPDALHLVEIDVHPAHQGRGLGRALVSAVVSRAKDDGRGAVTLTTFAPIAWNAPWYRRLGFRTLGPGERPARLEALLADEARRGLRERVAMRLEIEPRACEYEASEPA
jgi:GNAT superfamily N-acetyltransferase